MENWFKLDASYDSDIAIATVDDAAEVMFVRGLGYCRRSRSGGFIPTAVLHSLTRAPGRAKRIAAQLCRPATDGSPGPWEAVPGGYRVRNYEVHNEAADALEERRRSDRERKRRQRSRLTTPDPDPSTGLSRDGHGNVQREIREREEAAAAAPVTGPPTTPPAADLVAIEILASKLRQTTALAGLRTDKLRPEQAAALTELIAQHGDQRLVDQALAGLRRDDPPQTIQAFLVGWTNMPPPGQRLALVKQRLCDIHQTVLSPSGVCSSCASDKKAAR